MVAVERRAHTGAVAQLHRGDVVAARHAEGPRRRWRKLIHDVQPERAVSRTDMTDLGKRLQRHGLAIGGKRGGLALLHKVGVRALQRPTERKLAPAALVESAQRGEVVGALTVSAALRFEEPPAERSP